ncbi:hypothetical protein ACFPER_04360 [Agromyces aurantiacus]|uniref:Uncharacterized protein n=1 Tax=Agromyces aurantiacus TaxID=165814 RepID=A0ABV9R6S3_9MICO|nr:hypothetical protein [Agromyces aurantiacus]MBM7502690.1 hypothetical protein [Agromyces aurantiacus]
MTPDVEPVPPGAGTRDGAGLLFIFGVLVAAVCGGLRMTADGAAGTDPTFDLWLWAAAIVTTLSTAGVIALVGREYQSRRRFGVGIALVAMGVLATAGVWLAIAAL